MHMEKAVDVTFCRLGYVFICNCIFMWIFSVFDKYMNILLMIIIMDNQ